MIEFWRAGGSESTTSAELAKQREEEGWDGQMFMDSQSLSADPYVLMGAWAVSTKQLKLCTSTTNPLTRHPVVTAACAATLQSITEGRTILGIGRGDSALAYLGYAPASLKVFKRTLEELQTLLRGGEVDFHQHETTGMALSSQTLTLHDRPKTAQLQWLPQNLPKVPLDVAATGPKVIEMSAPIAERVTFSVGAIAERLQWALKTAKAARLAKGLNDEGISYGAQVIVICHTDINAVMETAASLVAPLARFQVMQNNAAGPLNESDEKNFAAIRKGYNMTKHREVNTLDKLGEETLSEEFIRRFAIVGPPDYCIERLLELHALGIERFVVVGPGLYPEPEPDRPGLFIREVMPALRTIIE